MQRLSSIARKRIASRSCSFSTSTKEMNGMGKVVGGAAAAGAVVGVAQKCAHAEDESAPNATADVVLYQYTPCPYCNKVKAALDYFKVPYQVVEVNPLTKKELKAITDYNKVPFALVKGKHVRESTEIITEIQRQFVPERSQEDDEEAKWREWIDASFIKLMPPNIYRSVPESLQSFDYLLTTGNFSTVEKNSAKYVGAAAMYLISKRLKKRYGIEEPRDSLYQAIEQWLEAVDDKDFLGGSQPNLADVSVFGVMRSIIGLDTFDDVMKHTDIEPWYKRMEQAVGDSSQLK